MRVIFLLTYLGEEVTNQGLHLSWGSAAAPSTQPCCYSAAQTSPSSQSKTGDAAPSLQRRPRSHVAAAPCTQRRPYSVNLRLQRRPCSATNTTPSLQHQGCHSKAACPLWAPNAFAALLQGRHCNPGYTAAYISWSECDCPALPVRTALQPQPTLRGRRCVPCLLLILCTELRFPSGRVNTAQPGTHPSHRDTHHSVHTHSHTHTHTRTHSHTRIHRATEVHTY